MSQCDSQPVPLRRLFSRLPLPIVPGQIVTLQGEYAGEYVVDTVKIADDLRDAKCTLVERHDHEWGKWIDDPAGVIRYCRRCPEIDWRPEG